MPKKPAAKKAAPPKSAPAKPAKKAEESIDYPVGKPIKTGPLKAGAVIQFTVREKDNAKHPDKDDFEYGTFKAVVLKVDKKGVVSLRCYDGDETWETALDAPNGRTLESKVAVTGVCLTPLTEDDLKPAKKAPKEQKSYSARAGKEEEGEEEDEDFDDGGVQYEL